MQNHTEPCEGSYEEVAPRHDQIRAAMQSIGGKWKLEILWLLSQRMHRFNELRRAIPGVTQHMLTQQLRELENDGLISRTVYPEVPPRVEYAIAEPARRLRPVFEALFAWMAEGRNASEPVMAEAASSASSLGEAR